MLSLGISAKHTKKHYNQQALKHKKMQWHSGAFWSQLIPDYHTVQKYKVKTSIKHSQLS